MATEKLTKPGLFEPLVSVVIVLIIMYLGYMGWLHWKGLHLSFQAEVVKLLWQHAPTWAVRVMREGGPSSTLTGMMLLGGYREVFALGGLFLGILGIVVWHYAFPEKPPKPVTEEHHILKLTSPYVYVTVPALSEDVPVAEQYLRLDRREVKLARTSTSPIEKLEQAVLEILAAHSDHTADPAGHHASATLFRHSIDVAKLLQSRSQDQLARVTGLAHDFGKLVAYQRDARAPGGWRVAVTAHDTMSANLIRLMPEYNALPEDEQRVLRYVLKYYHTPHLAPAQTPNRARILMQKLRFADGLVTGAEQKTATFKAGDKQALKQIADTLLEIIPNLNINKYRTQFNAEGFTGAAYDYCAVMEHPLRTHLSTHLQDEKLVQALALRHQRSNGTEHPAVPVIREALKFAGILVETYDGVTPENGRFEIKSGTVTFKDCFLLDRGKLERMYPDQIKAWGEKPPYRLSVRTRVSRDEPQPSSPG